jgi:hypothetical protein
MPVEIRTGATAQGIDVKGQVPPLNCREGSARLTERRLAGMQFRPYPLVYLAERSSLRFASRLAPRDNYRKNRRDCAQLSRALCTVRHTDSSRSARRQGRIFLHPPRLA